MIVAETEMLSFAIAFTATNSPPKKTAGEISVIGILEINPILLYCQHLQLRHHGYDTYPLPG